MALPGLWGNVWGGVGMRVNVVRLFPLHSLSLRRGGTPSPYPLRAFHTLTHPHTHTPTHPHTHTPTHSLFLFAPRDSAFQLFSFSLQRDAVALPASRFPHTHTPTHSLFLTALAPAPFSFQRFSFSAFLFSGTPSPYLASRFPHTHTLTHSLFLTALAPAPFSFQFSAFQLFSSFPLAVRPPVCGPSRRG
jgi:hypothetical protein